MIKASSYLGLATFFLILYSSTCWSGQLVTGLVTGKFTDVSVSMDINQKYKRAFVSHSYKYSLAGNIDRVKKPLVRLFCFVEHKDGSYVSWAMYSNETWGDLRSVSSTDGSTFLPYEFIKLGSAKQSEVSFQSVKNTSVSKAYFNVNGKPNPNDLSGKTINGKTDYGKILWFRLELWLNGELIAEYNTVNKAVLDSKKIPEDWYIYKKYPEKIDNKQSP